jgi:hypothetical protein
MSVEHGLSTIGYAKHFIINLYSFNSCSMFIYPGIMPTLLYILGFTEELLEEIERWGEMNK